MSITIASIGLATAQGSAAEVSSGAAPTLPQAVPWRLPLRAQCGISYPARGVANHLEGPDRWAALARAALRECIPYPQVATPLVIASCNGGAHSTDAESWLKSYDARLLLAGTPWEGLDIPVVSGSCASGLQALYLAARLLSDEAPEVVVLAVDILSSSSHENFESLKVLAANPTTPWQTTSLGFVPGEAAVAVRITRNGGTGSGVRAGVPILRQDLDSANGLRDVVRALQSRAPSLVVGQGTGPWAVDKIELGALDSLPDHQTPITTPVLHFGHTLGASGLLSMTLATLARTAGGLPAALRMPRGMTGTDRPLADRVSTLQHVLVICRALSGACAGVDVGSAEEPMTTSRQSGYRPPPALEPAVHDVLRRIAVEAPRVRPATPPAILLVRLEAPLVPLASGVLGHRLLPHAVLEITPASIPRAIARAWGYDGPALCLVGDGSTEAATETLVAACRVGGRNVAQVKLGGTDDARSIEWDVSPS